MISKIQFFVLIPVIFCILLTACNSIGDGLDNPNNLWENLSGKWRLTSTYTINNEQFLTSSCDQLTILNFRTLSEDELSTPVNDIDFTIVSHVEIFNNNCDFQFLNLGAIIGETNLIPITLDLNIQLIKECFNCLYSDIQIIDVLSCQTNGEKFLIETLSDNELKLKFLTNIYNRQFDNQVILDTLEYTFNRSESDIYTVSEFDINDYDKVDWYHFEENDTECGNTNATIADGGIDGRALSFNNRNSHHNCINYSLKSAMGEDNIATLSLWIKPESVNLSKQIIYSKYDNLVGPFILSLENDEVVLEVNNGFGELQRFASFGKVEANEWTHISLSYEEEDLLLCLNGEIDRRENINSWLYDADGTVLLGNSQYALDNGLEQGFVGDIDEFIIFKNYLNQDVIYQLYQWHLNN